MKQPKISVVTVNFNNAAGLEKTIINVLNQSYKNIEFIIVDGGSTDSSLLVIEQYRDQLDIVIIEKDKGVYDAMNKGIKASSGKWINFMNSGDVFYQTDTLHNTFERIIPMGVKLIYGCQYKYNCVCPPLPMEFLELGIIHACHQAMFFDSSIIYNCEYTIYADYDLVARIYKSKPSSLLYINEVICEFEGGGISSVASKEKRSDKYLSVYKNFGFKYVMSAFIYMLVSKLIKK